ncbi:MAG: RNA methyltransferase PUA domain-containing protein, partial [Crocinitomicaceae bacterium]
MAQFYLPTLSENDRVIELNEEESKHSIRVLRLGLGDTLTLLNGKGLSAHGKIVDAHPKKCKVQVDSYNVHAKTKE